MFKEKFLGVQKTGCILVCRSLNLIDSGLKCSEAIVPLKRVCFLSRNTCFEKFLNLNFPEKVSSLYLR